MPRVSKDYILSIDQGTTGTTVVVYQIKDQQLMPIGKKTTDFPQHFPKAGWVEHDLNEIWGSLKSSVEGAEAQAKEVNAGFSLNQVAAIGITNQRETLCVFDRHTSEPLFPAIVWQCKRSLEICDELKANGLEDAYRGKTGLFLDPYFSGTKLAWMLRENQQLRRDLSSGKVAIGTIDTYLMHRLSSADGYCTEASNASRTLLFDIKKGEWDVDLARELGLDSVSVLPEVKSSYGEFTKTKNVGFLPDGIPISGCLGDQQAALAGQRCFAPGLAKCTYGTGAFLLRNIGNEFALSEHGLLTTVAWSAGGELIYALEGAAFIAGAAVQFIRDQFGFLTDAKDSEAMSQSVHAAPEIYFVPSLAGLGVPYWEPDARGAILGLTRGASKNQIVRATLEGVAFQVMDLLEAMSATTGSNTKALRVDGGAAANSLLMQSQANFCQTNIERPHNLETTALGAGLFAALGAGVFSGLEDLQQSMNIERTFLPESGEHLMEQVKGWRAAIKAVQAFAQRGDS